MFPFLRGLIDDGHLAVPLRLIHIDAHADLGMGDAAYIFLITDLLHRPLGERADNFPDDDGLTSGNWLAFAIANQWVSQLLFPQRDDEADDFFPFYWDPKQPEELRMRAATKNQVDDVISGRSSIDDFRVNVPATEPPVSMHRPPLSELHEGPADFMFVCRSPNYSPAAADPLFDRVCERIQPLPTQPSTKEA
ncbi:MAG: UPF0489 family protein [Deltaproteobacteria bacterium]|nr:UPF0489 family protein [Deltaproteobacteria bacterium]